MRKVRVQLMVMLLLCGAAGIMAGFKEISGNHQNGWNVMHPSEASPIGRQAIDGWRETEAEETSNRDLELLTTLGMKHMEPSALLTVKIQGGLISSFTEDQAKTAAQQLAYHIGLPGGSTSLLHGNEVFQATGKLSGISVQLHWAITKEEHSYVRVMLTGEAAGHTRAMISLKERIQEQMKQAGIPNEWNASIQGYSLQSTNVLEAMEGVEESAAQILSLRMVEEYEDDYTSSRSYQAPSLGNFVESGNTPIHMQLAVHEDSVKKKNRITIGFPVITTEY